MSSRPPRDLHSSEELLRDDELEPERYELDEAPAYRFERGSTFDLDRREFLAVLGAGILVSARGSVSLAQERRSRTRGGSRGGGSISERVHIGVDGAITVLTGKVEVGQGSRTQLTMAAAEELRVPIGRIRLVMADTSLVPNDGGTSGSRTTPSTVPRVRRACAAARELLLETAAAEWKVDRTALRVQDAEIIGPGPDQKLSYAALVERSFRAGLKREIKPDVSVSHVSSWKILGTDVPKIGATAIVTGRHRYPADIVRPGMLYGTVLRPPSYGAKLKTIDLAPAPQSKAMQRSSPSGRGRA